MYIKRIFNSALFYVATMSTSIDATLQQPLCV